MKRENVSNKLSVISELYSTCLCFLNSDAALKYVWTTTLLTLIVLFQNTHSSPLSTQDTWNDLFDEVSLSIMIMKLFSLQDYCYCYVLCSINLSTSLYLFSVVW